MLIRPSPKVAHEWGKPAVVSKDLTRVAKTNNRKIQVRELPGSSLITQFGKGIFDGLDFTPDNRYVVAACSRELHVFETDTGKKCYSAKLRYGQCKTLATDGIHVIMGTTDEFVTVLTFAELVLVSTLYVPDVTCVDICGNMFAAASNDDTVSMWTTDTFSLRRMCSFQSYISAVAITSYYVIVRCWDRETHILDRRTGRTLRTLQSLHREYNSLRVRDNLCIDLVLDGKVWECWLTASSVFTFTKRLNDGDRRIATELLRVLKP